MLAVGTPLLAQAPTAPDATLHALQTAAQRNQLVRLTVEQKDFIGRIRYVDAQRLTLGTRDVAWAHADSIQLRYVDEDPVWNGALIGAAVNAPLALLLVNVAAGIGESPVTDRDTANALVGGALAGAVLGIVVDAMSIGPASWRTVWRR